MGGCWTHEPGRALVFLIANFAPEPRTVDGLTIPAYNCIYDRTRVFHHGPLYRGFIHGLRSGRTLPGTRLWGVVEYNLTEALAQVWAELLADPDADVEESLRRYLDPAARRLSLTLES